MTCYEKIRPANPSEVFYEVAQKDFKFLLSVYRLTLNSRKPLQEKDLKRTFSLLYNHIETLHLCLRKFGEEIWFCKMAEEKLDLQNIKTTQDFEEAFCDTISESFDASVGPLWRAKFLLENRPTKKEEINKTVNPEYIYENEVMICFHHGISDGFSSFTICSTFLKLLNDVVGGNDLKYSKPFGILGSDEETEKLIYQRKEYLEGNPELFEKIKVEMKNFDLLTPLFIECFPVDPDFKNCSKNLSRTLTQSDNAKLNKIFKSHGVTFHAGFCAIANWALVELLKEKGVLQETYDIGVYHAVNMRRYWPVQDVPVLGCHIGSLRTLTKTKHDVENHLWKYAQKYTETLHNYLKNQRPVDEAIGFILASSSGDSDLNSLFSNPPPLNLYYSTSNMGDITNILPGTGEHVEISWLNRSTSHYNLNISMVHTWQTFRGRLLYSLCYTCKYVSTELAHKYVDKIFEKLTNIIKES